MLSAEQYLGQLRVIDIQIQQDIRRLDEARHAASGMTAIQYDKDNVQTSPESNRLCLDVARYVELEKKLDAEIDRFCDIKNQLIGEIRALHTPKSVDVLYRKYVEFKTLAEIAEAIGLSYIQIKRVHNNALREFEERWPCRYWLT